MRVFGIDGREQNLVSNVW